MADKQTIAILRELLEGIESKLEQRIDTLENQLAEMSQKLDDRSKSDDHQAMDSSSGGGVPATHEELATMQSSINSHMQGLGQAIGEVHTAVSNDQALPEKLLMQPVMEQFVRSYPHKGKQPFPSKKREEVRRQIKQQPDSELSGMLETIAEQLRLETLSAKAEFNLHDAQRMVQTELAGRERERVSRQDDQREQGMER